MNTLGLIDKFIDKSTDSVSYLQGIWNNVWNEKGHKSYSQLRFYKTQDKIEIIRGLGVDFTDKSVLDIGCGDGTTLQYLHGMFGSLGVGIDISQDVIAKNKTKYSDNKDVRFGVGDHRDTGLSENTFDIVLSWGVVEHMEDYSLAIIESRRVLKPGGILVMIQPNLYSFGVLQELYLRLTKKWRYGNQKNFTYNGIRKTLKTLGLKNIVMLAKEPYKDMPVSRACDLILNKIFKYWGHYLYIISRK